MTRRQFMTAERGSGSILVVAIIAAVIALAALSAPVWGVLVLKNRLAAAAENSALAAADVAVGRMPGEPCETAASVAHAVGAIVAVCEADGLVMTVVVSGTVAGFPVTGVATAGPPPQ